MDTIERENNGLSNIFEISVNYENAKEIVSKYSKLPEYWKNEIYNKVIELFSLEPKQKGRKPTSIGGLYDRLSPSSKREVTKQVNRAFGTELKNNRSYTEPIPKTVATNNVIMLNFKKTRGKNKETRAVSNSFVAYETDWCFGVKGYLRHKFNCKDKSKDNLGNLIQDMEMALRGIASEETIKNDPKYRQCANSRALDIPISQTVTEAQKRILQRIQSTCESELLIDLCNDNTIRIKNNWNVCLIFEYVPSNGEIIITGNNLDVENYLRGLNVYF